ncbi:amidase [Amycolatopsis mongoliensis]|uniref:Amidase n=1 Tax=Amycolatopsis mongoliensis TaxID=715475 RepID=A0A9Y2JMA1_9PSEU|nr:amidase [Amycolatopsis sp. 4-36]WIY01130.1 amidase [Amycolatopsis sp. 4-36]
MTRYRPWSLRDLVADIAAGRTTPEDAVARARARIAATDAELHAWVAHVPSLDPATGPLGGVPLAVKDIIDLAGLPTRCGSALRADAPPAASDAVIVERWRHAGAVPIGKTVTTEFAFFSPGPTGNPAAPGHTPGGSSSGSAAAVAAGHVPLALGSQTAGSVTRPASFCGVAALVMSRGRIPADGVTGLSPSLDSHGLFVATASDAALAWSALTGEPEVPPRPPRLLVWHGSGETRATVDAAAGKLKSAGAVAEEFPDPALIASLTAAHPVVMAYEAARERAEELAMADRLSAQLANLLRTGAAMSREDYEQAQATIAAGGRRLAEICASYDAVLAPAAPGPAPRGLAATGDPVLSRPWQALGLAVATVPGLRDDAGLPLGLQLVGKLREEAALLGAARWVEDALTP